MIREYVRILLESAGSYENLKDLMVKVSRNKVARQAHIMGGSVASDRHPRVDLNDRFDDLLRRSGIKKIGEGGTRDVYLVETGEYEPFVLKHEISFSGKVKQNRHEVECYEASQGVALVPRLYDWAPGFEWIEIEYLRPITEREFKSLTGMKWGDFTEALYQNNWIRDNLDAAGLPKRLESQINAVLSACSIDLGELDMLDHWGANSKGQLKIRDLGT